MPNNITTLQKVEDSNSEVNALNFVILQALRNVNTVKLVEIMPFLSNQNPGTVNVRPLVNMMAGNDTQIPHGTIYNIPYFRLQSGLNAVIIDPQVGDIGACGFCDRDISVVKKTGNTSPPGSYRLFDYADGLYFGGIMMLNQAPTNLIKFDSDGITLTSPIAVTINANLNVIGNTTFLGTVKSNGHSIDSNHQHINSGGSGLGGIPQ